MTDVDENWINASNGGRLLCMEGHVVLVVVQHGGGWWLLNGLDTKLVPCFMFSNNTCHSGNERIVPEEITWQPNMINDWPSFLQCPSNGT